MTKKSNTKYSGNHLDFEAVTKSYLAELRLRKLSPNSIHAYERTVLRRFLPFIVSGQKKARVTMGDVTAEKATAYIQHRMDKTTIYEGHPSHPVEERPLSVHTIHQDVRGLKAFGVWLGKNGYNNPFSHLKLPKLPQRLVDILTREEIDLLLWAYNPDTAFGARWQAMVTFWLDTGVRISELVSLRVQDVDFEILRAKVVGGKGDKDRFVRFGDGTYLALTRYVNLYRPNERNAETLFTSLAGEAMTLDGAQNILKGIKKKTGIKRLHSHLFRHTFATYFLMNGLGSEIELRDLLGHTSLTMTSRYVHLAQQLRNVSLPRTRRSILDDLKIHVGGRGTRPRGSGRRLPAQTGSEPGTAG